MNNVVIVKFLAFTVFSLLLLMILFNTMVNRVSGGTDTYSAVFEDVSGLRAGDDVRAAGVKVGRVESIDLYENTQAEVTFTLNRTQEITDTTRLRMRYQNLLGQRYLSLEAGGSAGSPLSAGAQLGTDQTDPGFDLTALMNGFAPLFETLQPEEINQLAESLVAVLQGEAGTIESLFVSLGDVSQTLVADEDAFVNLLDNLTPVLVDLSSKSDDFEATIAALTDMMNRLADEKQIFGEPLERISALANELATLTQQVRPLIPRDFAALVETGTMVAEVSGLFGEMLTSLPLATAGFVRPMATGAMLNAYICELDADVLGLPITLLNTGSPSGVCA